MAKAKKTAAIPDEKAAAVAAAWQAAQARGGSAEVLAEELRARLDNENKGKTRTRRPWGGTCWARSDRGGVYYLKFRGPDGRTVVRNSETTDRAEAERLLAKLTGEAAPDEETGIRAMTAAQFVPEHMAAWAARKNVKRVTRKRAGKVEERWDSSHANIMEAQLGRFTTWAGPRKLHTLTLADVENYTGWLQTGKGAVGPATVSRYVAAVSGMFRTAVQRKVAKNNPCKGAELPKSEEFEAVFLAAGEIDRLISHCPEGLRAAVVILADCGMRLGELLKLTWQRVAADDSSLYLVHTKSKRNRYAPTTARVRVVLAELRAKHSTPIRGEDFLLPKPRSKSRIERLFVKAVEAAGLDPRTTPHALRHSYASGMANDGTALSVISKALGHGSMRVTERYADKIAGNAVSLAVSSLERSRVAATTPPAAKEQAQAG